MEAHCTYDPMARALWVGVAGSNVRLRFRLSGQRRLPIDFISLNGGTVRLAELRRRLPPISTADFRPTTYAYPELRARSGDWHVSVLTPQAEIYSKDDGLDLLRRWLSEAWP